ncbi:MAG TPA: hypothetical protein ENJ82_07730, partial [Bacteroidetes bacterium]|nr:hypothetical protein [Bacteroidota bacterium]
MRIYPKNWNSKFYFILFITAFFGFLLPGEVDAQLTLQVRVNRLYACIGDCDGSFVNSGPSEPRWFYEARDFPDYDGSGFQGGNYQEPSSNSCGWRNRNTTFFSSSYQCNAPTNIQFQWEAYENDFVGNDAATGNQGLFNFPVNYAASQNGVWQTMNLASVAVNDNDCSINPGTWDIEIAIRWTGSLQTPPVQNNICTAAGQPALATNGTVYTFSNLCATVESGEVDASPGNISPSRTTWHHFVAPPTGHVIVSTDHGGTTFDTEIAIYHQTGTICGAPNWGALAEVGANDDIVVLINRRSRVELECLVPGDTYWIQMDGDDATDQGNYQVNVTNQGGPPLPTNDAICNAINLGTLNFGGNIGSNTFSNLCATTQPGEPNPSAFAPNQTVWFNFTTGATVGTEVLLAASNDPLNRGDQIDLQVALYTSSNGNCSGAMSEVGSDYFTPPFAEDLTVNCLLPNTTYWVQIDGSGLNTEGYFGLAITDNGIARASNDDICNAVNLGTVALSQTIANNGMNNFCATTQPGEPAYPGCLVGINQTVWAQFTTGSSLGYEMTFTSTSDPLNIGDNLDLKIGVYTSSNGLCSGTLTALDCSYLPDAPGFWTGENLT